jgi:hypothetical protein
MSDLPRVRIGPLRKKWVMFDDMSVMCVETDPEGYPKISSATLPREYFEEEGRDMEEVEVEPPTFLLPYEEFREIVFFLPEFKDLAILENARQVAGEPQKFIVKCFDATHGREDGDELFIDTQGYDYARYKAPVLERLV